MLCEAGEGSIYSRASRGDRAPPKDTLTWRPARRRAGSGVLPELGDDEEVGWAAAWPGSWAGPVRRREREEREQCWASAWHSPKSFF